MYMIFKMRHRIPREVRKSVVIEKKDAGIHGLRLVVSRVHPIIDREFSRTDAASALHHLAPAKRFGTIALRFDVYWSRRRTVGWCAQMLGRSKESLALVTRRAISALVERTRAIKQASLTGRSRHDATGYEQEELQLYCPCVCYCFACATIACGGEISARHGFERINEARGNRAAPARRAAASAHVGGGRIRARGGLATTSPRQWRYVCSGSSG